MLLLSTVASQQVDNTDSPYAFFTQQSQPLSTIDGGAIYERTTKPSIQPRSSVGISCSEGFEDTINLSDIVIRR